MHNTCIYENLMIYIFDRIFRRHGTESIIAIVISDYAYGNHNVINNLKQKFNSLTPSASALREDGETRDGHHIVEAPCY